LRDKIIGAFIRDARLTAQKTIEECAAYIGVAADDFEAFELGTKSVSLPELEAISYFLQIPLDHFWEREPLAGSASQKQAPDIQMLIRLRQRMIGAMLRQARMESKLSISELAERLGIPAEELEAYELGKQPIPLPWLELLSGVLNRSIREFQDQKGPVGSWNAQQRALRDFQALPTELQTFISKPVNRPYLDLAFRLSGMPVEKLRAVAEGLLEITY
jgi:transcriptional regulator with XRE-family HTH domain